MFLNSKTCKEPSVSPTFATLSSSSAVLKGIELYTKLHRGVESYKGKRVLKVKMK